MAQERNGIDLETSLGYLLKEASSALRVAMEKALRPLDMTITHYSCLELLSQRPGLSNSELARGTFVTRQSMNVLLQSLEQSGDVSRAPAPTSGRVLPTQLTDQGRERLILATSAVRDVEERMLADLSEPDRATARRVLRSMKASLSDG